MAFIFPVGGIVMILLGVLILLPLYGWRSVKVDAECIGVSVGTAVHKTGLDAADERYYPNSKCPRYRYYYEGKTYESGPLLTSNRPGYKPQTGPCEIRINPKHPERVYSTERKAAAAILIIIGVMWLAVPAVVGWLTK